MNKTKIDWCDSTWNPVTGCLHGCEYCYARRITNRFKGHADLDYFMKLEEHPEIVDEKIHVLEKPLARYNLEGSAALYPFDFEPTFHRYRLNDYIDKKGRNIFVCSMADLFGEWVLDSWIEEVFKACEKAPQHNYLFLTKNPDRYIKLLLHDKLPEYKNMWYGMSITKKNDTHTAEAITQELPSEANAFLSIEPILEDVLTENLEIVIANFCDWVIIGAETGRRKDKVIPKREWIEDIVNECRKADIPVFMKSSLADIWGKPLIQEFPEGLKKFGLSDSR